MSNTLPRQSARYEHDCGVCVWLGQAGQHDAYACPQGIGYPTVVLRWGDEGPEYASGRHLIDELPAALQEKAAPLFEKWDADRA